MCFTRDFEFIDGKEAIKIICKIGENLSVNYWLIMLCKIECIFIKLKDQIILKL